MLIRVIALSSVIVLAACNSDNGAEETISRDDGQSAAQANPLNEPMGVASNQADAPQADSQSTSIDGVITTASGLQYEVLRAADGNKPGPNSIVTVHYVGTLTDGTVFDSSYVRGNPATFSLQEVILGWTEGVQLMNIGSQYRFTIPPHLGYGNRQVSDIPPNSTLIFEVELLEINS